MTSKTQVYQGLQGLHRNNFSRYFANKVVQYQGLQAFFMRQLCIPLVQVAKQVILSKSVVLLLGSMIVGYITGPKGMETVEVFYKGIFMGMLSLFMLEMGMVAATKISDLKKTGAFLVLFGIITPIVNAALGVTIGVLVGLSLGGVTLLGVLAASCSYIVAPAAMRVSLPKANPALYLGASLGVTLPFNLVIGIPLYYQMANYFIMITR